ncbi:MAG TPA: hypothetical protein VH371_11080 [Candidatus Limnocylindrales bacterium]
MHSQIKTSRPGPATEAAGTSQSGDALRIPAPASCTPASAALTTVGVDPDPPLPPGGMPPPAPGAPDASGAMDGGPGDIDASGFDAALGTGEPDGGGRSADADGTGDPGTGSEGRG